MGGRASPHALAPCGGVTGPEFPWSSPCYDKSWFPPGARRVWLSWFARHHRLLAERLVWRSGGKAASTSLTILANVSALIRARMNASSSGSDAMRETTPLRCARRCAALISTAVKGVFTPPLTAWLSAPSRVLMVRALAARRSSIWQTDLRAWVIAVRIKPASITPVAGLLAGSIVANHPFPGVTR